MIAHVARNVDAMDIWTKIAAPLEPDAIQWRQDGKATQRDGKFYARFVAYVDAQFVRARLDSVVPGEWDLTLESLPANSIDAEEAFAFKARIQILGVIREDVGTGSDYKSASSDAFKRAAVRFGIAHELYAYEQNWVQVDSDSKFAKPVEDPGAAYARRTGRAVSTNGSNGNGARPVERSTAVPTNPVYAAPAQSADVGPRAIDEPTCPKCDGRMWSNVAENNARAEKGEKLRPDYKCRDRGCEGVIWRPKGAAKPQPRTSMDEAYAPAPAPVVLEPEEDGLPF